jgi:hypothetical protein
MYFKRSVFSADLLNIIIALGFEFGQGNNKEIGR